MKPWLFAILRNVCRAEFARRASSPTGPIDDVPDDAEQTPLWHEAQETPEAQMLRRWDATTIRRLVTALAEPFRETFVLREIQQSFVSRNRRCRRGAGRHRDVPSRARPRHAAIGMDGGRGATEMTCDEAEILLHALIDGELDAGHAREVEDHIAGCPRCAAQLAAYREMSKAVAGADLRYTAPPALRRRIEASLPQAQTRRRTGARC